MQQKRVLIVKNVSHEGPGLIEGVLKHHRIGYDIVDFTRGKGNLPNHEEYGAVIVMGGPDSANDKTRKMKRELKFVRSVLDSGKPFLGICLGLQVRVKAGNGQVMKNVVGGTHVKEIGTHDNNGEPYKIVLTPDGKADPLFKHLHNPRENNSEIEVFHLHGETVKPHGRFKLLATGKHCAHQVVKFGRAQYGIQGHFELTGEMLEEWLQKDADLKKADGKAIRQAFNATRDERYARAWLLFNNFLKTAHSFSEALQASATP